MKKLIIPVCLFAFLLILPSCGNKGLRKNLTLEERFIVGKEQFEKENYLGSRLTFEALSYLSAGKTIMDSVQFLLGDSYFHIKEYISAAAEFRRLIRDIPNSPLTDDCQFKIAMCYYKLSPKYSLDQDYTLEGIKQFQIFLENYSNSNLVEEATVKYRDLRSKLAKKDFTTGIQYKKMGNVTSAIIYFDLILTEFFDTVYYQKSLFEKAECLFIRKEYGKSMLVYQDYVLRFPQTPEAEKARKKIKEIGKKQKSQTSAKVIKKEK